MASRKPSKSTIANSDDESDSDSTENSSDEGSSSVATAAVASTTQPKKESSSSPDPTPDYHMRTARVSRRCNEIIFKDQSDSSCQDQDVFTDILTSTLHQRDEHSEIDPTLAMPVKQRLLFPGLSQAIAAKEGTHSLRKHKETLREMATNIVRSAAIPRLEFKDFATESCIKLSPIRGRHFYPSDAGLYDTFPHTLAFSNANKLFYVNDPDPGLERDLPVQIDASKDVRLLIGEFARTQATVNKDLITVSGSGKTAEANKHKLISHLQSFKINKPDFTLTAGGFVDADISVGINGARIFDRENEEQLEWPPDYLANECGYRKGPNMKSSSGYNFEDDDHHKPFRDPRRGSGKKTSRRYSSQDTSVGGARRKSTKHGGMLGKLSSDKLKHPSEVKSRDLLS